MLEIPFAAIDRDSDGDGLTDLAEERLITDPQSADTDGDGLPDGSDSLPQVPWTAVLDDRARALAAVLRRIAGMESRAIIHEIPPAGPAASGRFIEDLLSRARRATLTDEETTFMVGDRHDFRALLTTQRGFVIWDASWVGGVLRLRLVGTVWQVESVMDWIT